MKRASISVICLFVLISTSYAAPIHLHITTESDPATSVTITWQTGFEVSSGTLEYGIDENYGMTIEAVSHTYTSASGMIWDARITGLQAATEYHYRCGSNEDGWSPDHTFRTAPLPGEPFEFVALGDSRTNVEIWQAICDRVYQEENPDLVIHSGDLVLSGVNQNNWDAFFDGGATLLAETIFIPIEGNHDTSNLFYEQFALPSNGGNGEKYFSFTWGDMHLIALNTETGIANITGAQRTFLLSELATHTEDLWKIALFHKPFYSCGRYEGDMDIYKDDLLEPMDEYRVDLCFNAHEHVYQRTVPIRGDREKAQYGSGENDGMCHIITGGAGAPLYELNNCWWVAHGIPINHYCKIRIDGTSIQLDAIDIDGQLIESVSWTKTFVPITPTPSPIPSPTLTPTIGPTVTPTPTFQLGVELLMPALHFHPDDIFSLTLRYINRSTPLHQVPVVTVLAVANAYWFAPSWESFNPATGEGFEYWNRNIPYGISDEVILPQFSWPHGAGSLSDIVFIAGILSDDFNSIRGEFASITWAFSE